MSVGLAVCLLTCDQFLEDVRGISDVECPTFAWNEMQVIVVPCKTSVCKSRSLAISRVGFLRPEIARKTDFIISLGMSR